MISELLEETGIDRQQIRKVRRQVLEGIILLCQWQLARMDRAQARRPQPPAGGKGRRVAVD